MRSGRSKVLRLLHGRRDALIITLIVILLGFISLYGMGELTPSESEHAMIVEGLCSQDLTLDRLLSQSTSPLYEGAVLLVHQLLGEGEVSALSLRLPSLIATILLFVGFYVLICLRKSRSSARVTLFLLLSTPLYHYHIMTGEPGPFGVLFATWALAIYHRIATQDKSRPAQHSSALLCGVIIALAGLSIGLAGLIIPLLSITLWTVMGLRERIVRLTSPLLVTILSSTLLLTLAALLPSSCLWLTNNVEGWSFRGLWYYLGLLLPWGIVIVMALIAIPPRVREVGSKSSLEGLSLLMIGCSLIFNLSTGTSEVAPTLMMAPFFCLIAGEYFRLLLYREPQLLSRLSLGINIVGILIMVGLILQLTGSDALVPLLGQNGGHISRAMTQEMVSHRALSLLLLTGPLVAALTMIYQMVRKSYVKLAYTGVLMVVLTLLATDIPLHALIISLGR